MNPLDRARVGGLLLLLLVPQPGWAQGESAIDAVTLAELAAGPHATDDEDERTRRQDRLHWAAATWDPLPFDADAARAYGRVLAAVRAAGRTSRSRVPDLLIASTGAAHGLPSETLVQPADPSLGSHSQPPMCNGRAWSGAGRVDGGMAFARVRRGSSSRRDGVYTRNPADLEALASVVRVVAL